MTAGDRFFIMRMMFGGQNDKYDFHRVGLNHDFLGSFLFTAGFRRVYRVPEFNVFDSTEDSSSKLLQRHSDQSQHGGNQERKRTRHYPTGSAVTRPGPEIRIQVLRGSAGQDRRKLGESLKSRAQTNQLPAAFHFGTAKR